MSVVGKGLLIYGDDTGGTNMRLVTFCKECAYMERGVKDCNEVWCCWHDSRMSEDDFCSRGKEKEHDE